MFLLEAFKFRFSNPTKAETVSDFVISEELQTEMKMAQAKVLEYTDLQSRLKFVSEESMVIVEKDHVRELLLQAGYVAAALGEWKGADTDLNVIGKENPDFLKFHHQGWQRIDTLPHYFTSNEPETGNQAMSLRSQMLLEIDALRQLHPQLTAAGKHGFIGNWHLNRQKTDLLFYVNPTDQELYKSGWFTLAEIRSWLQDLGPIVRQVKRQ